MPLAATLIARDIYVPGTFKSRDNYMWYGSLRGGRDMQSSTCEVDEYSPSRNRKYMRSKMKDKWKEDPNFYGKFFRLKGSAWKHADAARNTWYDDESSRWKGVPAEPTMSSSLVMPLLRLLNAVLESSGFPPSRRLFLKPDPATMKASRSPLPAPGLLLAGTGPAMAANSGTEMLEAEYASGLVPVQIMLESSFREASRHLSAAHANEIFLEQDNRRFVYALIITESYLRLYMFDPSGAVTVPRIDYHAYPRNFCAVIEGIASLDEARAGFDTSISTDEHSVKRIWTTECMPGSPPSAVSYRVKSRLFRASKFVGRATCCWLVESDGESHEQFVIKDAWIVTTDTMPVLEGSLIRHANDKGVVRGLVRIKHEACVNVSGRSVDTIIKNRKMRKNTFSNDDVTVDDRVHSRIVMHTYGKPLHKFSNRKELLLALHDAINAHRDLILVAGILHRDISSGNILINPDGEEGDRGVLIDLDFAIHLDDLTPGYRMGTFKYMSLELLQNKQTLHSYLHDLESFYYVLIWIICEFDGPGDVEDSRDTKAPEAFQDWNGKSAAKAGAAKQTHLKEKFSLPVKPWFGTVVSTLAERLHGFFRRRSDPQLRRLRPALDPGPDYAEILGHFQWAIDELSAEDGPGPPPHCPSPPVSKDAGGGETFPSKYRKRKTRGIVSNVEHPKAKRVCLGPALKPSLAVTRPRRSKADYRQPAVPNHSTMHN